VPGAFSLPASVVNGIPDDMASPITPAQFEETIVNESDSVCTALKKLKFWVLWYRYAKWHHGGLSENGISNDLKAMICIAIANCPEEAEEEETTTTEIQ
jgi:hypothetical protein